MHYVKSGTREGEGNWNIWHKKMQELNPNTSENYHLNSTGVCVCVCVCVCVTTHLLLSVAYPGILFVGGVQQIQLRTDDGYLGAVAPLSGVLEAAVIWYKKFHFM